MALVAIRCECGHQGYAPAAGFPRVLRCCACGRARIVRDGGHAIRGAAMTKAKPRSCHPN